MRARAALAILALAVCGTAAADFRTVEENAAVLYDAPSRAATNASGAASSGRTRASAALPVTSTIRLAPNAFASIHASAPV